MKHLESVIAIGIMSTVVVLMGLMFYQMPNQKQLENTIHKILVAQSPNTIDKSSLITKGL